LVDDNPVARNVMAKMMRANAWELDVAHGGLEALATVERAASHHQRAYDFVFLDWQLSDMDAWQVVAQLHSRGHASGAHALKIIMVSSNGRDNLSLRTQQEQALISGFLVKPVTRTDLLLATRTDASERANLRREQRSGHRELQGLKILVVEDNAINQQVAEGLLGALGAVVSIAADGRQGVNAIASAKEQYDLVLMDIQMPVMDGYEATHLIRTQLELRQLPIIGLSANAMASDRDKCLAAGMNEHVGKPFDIVQLVSLVIRLTGHRAPGAAAVPAGSDAGLGGSVSADSPALDAVQMDLPSALQRLGGQQALYSRLAQDLLDDLPTLVGQLDQATAQGDVKKAAACLHTYKGTTATLGLVALSKELARLESLCVSGMQPADRETLLHTLSCAVDAARSALSQAVDMLQKEGASAAAMPRSGARARLAAPLERLLLLLGQKDLTAIDLFAEFRNQLELASPSATLFAQLKCAMQALEFEEAERLCRAIADSV
jgi:CheY-like chemotaxis protein